MIDPVFCDAFLSDRTTHQEAILTRVVSAAKARARRDDRLGADDIGQEAALAVWGVLDSFVGDGIGLSKLINMIVSRKIIDAQRKIYRRAETELPSIEDEEPTDRPDSGRRSYSEIVNAAGPKVGKPVIDLLAQGFTVSEAAELKHDWRVTNASTGQNAVPPRRMS